MKIAVTGASGKLGRYVVAAFEERGDEVLGLDRNPPPSWRSHQIIDLQDLGQVYDALGRFRPEVVCHLAANPAPYGHPRHQQFMDNVGSTHAVIQASADLGVKRLVYASSEMANGWSSAHRCPPRLPFGEDDMIPPVNSYALSKKIGEEIAEAMVDKHPEMPIVSLRINFVALPEMYTRWSEGKSSKRSPNLWAYVDAGDAALAFVRAAEASTRGHRAYMVAARDTYAPLPTRQLIEQHFGSGIGFDDRLGEYGSPVDCSRIETELGWEPTLTFRADSRGNAQAAANV